MLPKGIIIINNPEKKEFKFFLDSTVFSQIFPLLIEINSGYVGIEQEKENI